MNNECLLVFRFLIIIDYNRPESSGHNNFDL